MAKKKKKLSKYEKFVITERKKLRASKQPLVKKTHEEWYKSFLRYHILDLKRKDLSITLEERNEMVHLKMPPKGWGEENVELPEFISEKEEEEELSE